MSCKHSACHSRLPGSPEASLKEAVIVLGVSSGDLQRHPTPASPGKQLCVRSEMPAPSPSEAGQSLEPPCQSPHFIPRGRSGAQPAPYPVPNALPCTPGQQPQRLPSRVLTATPGRERPPQRRQAARDAPRGRSGRPRGGGRAGQARSRTPRLVFPSRARWATLSMLKRHRRAHVTLSEPITARPEPGRAPTPDACPGTPAHWSLVQKECGARGGAWAVVGRRRVEKTEGM